MNIETETQRKTDPEGALPSTEKRGGSTRLMMRFFTSPLSWQRRVATLTVAASVFVCSLAAAVNFNSIALVAGLGVVYPTIPPSSNAPATGSDIPAKIASADWASLANSTLKDAVTSGEIPGATVVVVDRNETLFSAGYGVTNLETRDAVTDGTLFEVGSIGKVLTAIAVLQQVERGRLDMTADINTYLEDWKVETPDNEPITLHHLLTHSAGLNDHVIGYATREEDDLQTLGAHLVEHFPTSFAKPGQYISYSNYGFGLAGYLVETASGIPFTEYVASEILAPLGIMNSGYRPNIKGAVASGYFLRDEELSVAPLVHRSVTPAGSFVANARDMTRLLKALLNEGTPILSDESVAMMTENRQSQHPRLMGNAYGLEETRRGNLSVFGKGGSIPGFTAYMAVIPELDLGLFVAANASSDAAIDRFVVDTLDLLSTGAPALLPPVSIDVSRFVGEYRNNRYDRTSVEKLLRLDIKHIFQNVDHELAVWHDGDMNTYQAVDSLVFQNSVETNRFLVFQEDADGNVTHAYFSDRIAGGYIPVVWERNGFLDSNEYVNEYFGFPLLIALSYLLFPIVAIVVALRRRGKEMDRRNSRRWLNITGFTTSALVFTYVCCYFMPLMKARPDLIFGMPPNLSSLDILSWFIVGGFGVFAALWIREMMRGKKNLAGQIFGFIYIVSGVLVSEFFLRWNLL